MGSQKNAIRTGNNDYHMAVHYASVHDSNPSTLRIIGLEVVTRSIRKGDKLQIHLQREAFWIFQWKATIFPDLNEELDLTPYLWNDSSLWFLLVWFLFPFWGGMWLHLVTVHDIIGPPVIIILVSSFFTEQFVISTPVINLVSEIWHTAWPKCISVQVLCFLTF